MVVAVGELDLELDAGEERRRRVEHEAVRAGAEVVREASAPVAVGLRGGDGAGAPGQLDRDPDRGAPRRGVQHVGRERAAHGWPSGDAAVPGTRGASQARTQGHSYPEIWRDRGRRWRRSSEADPGGIAGGATARIFAPAPDGRGRCPPRGNGRARRRGRRPRRRRRAGRLGAGRRGQSPATGSSAPPSSRPSVAQTARSACLPGSSDPMSSRRSTSAPPRVPIRSASRAVIAVPPPRPRATRSACLTSRKRSLRSFEADPSTPSPTRAPASSRARTGATPLPAAGSTSGSARRPCPSPRTARPRRRRGGRSGRTTRRPRASRAARGTRPACSRRARGSTPPPRRSRRGACGGRGPSRRASVADSSISRPVTENGEQGATATCTRAPGPSSWNAAWSRSVSASTASSSSTSSSGGSPPSDTPRSIDPREATRRTPELARRLDLGLEDPGPAAREHVVVVEDGRAAGERELREPGARRRVLRLGVDPRPDGIELAEPREEVRLLRPAPA